jgi:hypothetical protein
MSLEVKVLAATEETDKVTYPCLRAGKLTGNIYLCLCSNLCYRIDGGVIAAKTAHLNVGDATVLFKGTVTLTSA